MTGRGATLRILCAADARAGEGARRLARSARHGFGRGVAFACTLAGDGPLRGEIGALVDALGLADRVTIAGRVPHDALLARLREGRLRRVALASIERDGGLMEGVPVALIEAMAAGVAVVATDSGSISELVDGDRAPGPAVRRSSARGGARALWRGEPGEIGRLRTAGAEPASRRNSTSGQQPLSCGASSACDGTHHGYKVPRAQGA